MPKPEHHQQAAIALVCGWNSRLYTGLDIQCVLFVLISVAFYSSSMAWIRSCVPHPHKTHMRCHMPKDPHTQCRSTLPLPLLLLLVELLLLLLLLLLLRLLLLLLLLLLA